MDQTFFEALDLPVPLMLPVQQALKLAQLLLFPVEHPFLELKLEQAHQIHLVTLRLVLFGQ
jgi:hypothetical protein